MNQEDRLKLICSRCYFESIRKKIARCDDMNNEIADLETLVGGAVDYSKPFVKSSSYAGGLEDSVENVIKRKHKLQDRIAELKGEISEAKKIVDRLEDGEDRIAIRSRYFDMLTFKQTGNIMRKDRNGVNYILCKALVKTYNYIPKEYKLA